MKYSPHFKFIYMDYNDASNDNFGKGCYINTETLTVVILIILWIVTSVREM